MIASWSGTVRDALRLEVRTLMHGTLGLNPFPLILRPLTPPPNVRYPHDAVYYNMLGVVHIRERGGFNIRGGDSLFAGIYGIVKIMVLFWVP